MANIDVGYLSALLKDGEVEGLKGVQGKWLLPEYRPIHEFVVGFFKKHKALPTRKTVEAKFEDESGITFIKKPETVAYYKEEIHNRALRLFLTEQMKEAAEHLEANEAGNGLEALKEIITSASKKFAVAEQGYGTEGAGTAERWKDYEERKAAGGLIGLPYPWESINEVTMGMLPGDLISFVARSGRGKTWVAMLIADHLVSLGYDVLFHSMEWREARLKRRTDAIGARLPAFDFLRGNLDKKQEKRYRRFLRAVKKGLPWTNEIWHKDKIVRGKYHFYDRRRVRSTLDLSMAIQQAQPDLVVCDAAYLMGKSKKPEDQASLVAELKDIAETYATTNLLTWQFNRNVKGNQKGGADQTDVGLTDALVQDGDCTFSLFQDEEALENKELHMEDTKIRDGLQLGRITLRWDLHHMEFFETASLGGDLDESAEYEED